MSLDLKGPRTGETKQHFSDKKMKSKGYEERLPSIPTSGSVCGITELQEETRGLEESLVIGGDFGTETPTERSDLKVRGDETCNKCGHDSPVLKTCSRCKKTRYCSRECQRSDWKNHRKTCKSGEGEVDNLIEQLKRSGDLQTFTLRTDSKMTLDGARVKAAELFPESPILDKMSVLDYRPAKGVFLGKVASLHMNMLKYGICVTDTDGKRLTVCFRLPGNKSEPYFQTDDIGFGSFVCVKGARLHPLQFNFFAKEKVCILVTDASTVRVIV